MAIKTLGVVGIMGTALTTCVVYDLVENNKARGTTIAGMVSALGSALLIPKRNEYDTEKYLDSLSDEQIIELEKRLEEREKDIVIEKTPQEEIIQNNAIKR